MKDAKPRVLLLDAVDVAADVSLERSPGEGSRPLIVEEEVGGDERLPSVPDDDGMPAQYGENADG